MTENAIEKRFLSVLQILSNIDLTWTTPYIHKIHIHTDAQIYIYMSIYVADAEEITNAAAVAHPATHTQ